jgi:very-short-patch-repair endonuclease
MGGYIVDFFCAGASLVIELDGGQHTDGDALRYDQERAKKLESLGVRVVRFWDHDVLREPQMIAQAIYTELERIRGAHNNSSQC